MRNRTFFATFFLFLITVNIGILLLATVMLRDTAESMRSRSRNDHYMIASSILNDFVAVSGREGAIDAPLDSLLYPYAYMAENRHGHIALFKDSVCLYTNLPESNPLTALPAADAGEQSTKIIKTDSRYHAFTTGTLPEAYSNYTLLLQTDVTEAFNAWSSRVNMMLLMGAVLSLVLAALLLLLLERLFRPLVQITTTSAKISAGDYNTRLPASGKDEIAKMAASFNHMAEKIQSQIAVLAADAEGKQRFIDDFAHELRTPLTAIYGYAEYMQRAVIAEDDRQVALENIMAESQRILAMAGQLMDLANYRSGDMEMESLDIHSLLQGVLRTLQGQIADKQLRVQLQCSLKTIRGNAGLLHSLFVNLLVNAIKASDKNGLINITAACMDGAHTVQIRDEGKGIPPEALSRITEPYFRVDKGRSRRDGGAGLGLALCQEIADRHLAVLRFASALGKGTTATVIFTTP